MVTPWTYIKYMYLVHSCPLMMSIMTNCGLFATYMTTYLLHLKAVLHKHRSIYLPIVTTLYRAGMLVKEKSHKLRKYVI